MELYELTLSKAHRLLKNGEISSKELTRSVLDRIRSVDDKIGAFISVTEDLALHQAELADQAIKNGEMTPLTGIPLSIKDLICTRDAPTTCGSNILREFRPPYDATVIRKLKFEQAVMVGKTNMDEFAMGSSTENSGIKITRNPWNLDKIPGGSSGGAAASVAAHMCFGALASDTGGSIRQPASHCGVVGIKPTYGRVSRFGLVAFASSLDQIGVMTKDVTDCAILLKSICGYDDADSTSVPEPVPDYPNLFGDGLKGMKIGIPKEYHSAEGVHPDVTRSIQRAITTLESLGAECIEVSLPHTEYGVAAYYVISPSEASSNLARYDGVKYGFRNPASDGMIDMYRKTRSKGFGTEVQRRIIIGTYCLSAGYYDAYYRKASQIRTLFRKDFTRAFDACDVIVAPVAPTPAFGIGENIDDPLTMYLTDIFTIPANLCGIPGISVPCGFSSDGLPIGLQIMGNHFDEKTLLKVAFHFEQANNIEK